MLSNIVEAIWQTLVNTPWWVYLILVYCVLIGVKASKPGIVSIWKMLFIPVIFLYMSLHTVLNSFVLTQLVILSYVASLVIGSLLGAFQASRQQVRVDRPHFLIGLSGSWSTLIIILLIFVIKYYFGYAIGADPHLLQNTHFELVMLAATGITTGLFVGRTLYYFIKLYARESVDLLEESKK